MNLPSIANDAHLEPVNGCYLFLCHSSHDSEFVIQVAHHLRRNIHGEVFYYEEHQRADQDFIETITAKAKRCRVMVTFVGPTFTEKPFQTEEISTALRDALNSRQASKRKFFTVLLPDPNGQPCTLPDGQALLEGRIVYAFGKEGSVTIGDRIGDRTDSEGARNVAIKIVTSLDLKWVSADGLPLKPHLFDYEKDIIQFFVRKRQLGSDLYQSSTNSDPDKRAEEDAERTQMREKLLFGCPSHWPDATYHTGPRDLPGNENLLRDIGVPRSHQAQVVAAALSSYHRDETGNDNVLDYENCPLKNLLCFREAGPRKKLRHTGKTGLKVAILVSGGIAPGINSLIDGITQRHWMYAESHGYKHGLRIFGLENGFLAFDAFDTSYRFLAPSKIVYNDATFAEQRDRGLITSEHANLGGSVLGTSRYDKLMEMSPRYGNADAPVGSYRSESLEQIVDKLHGAGIDILYVIGGDGSMRAAHAISNTARNRKVSLSVVGVPKTMDNDILWMWQSFGFLSAVEKAREVIEHLGTEVRSNPRLCVLQLFGSDSGFVVSHAVLASPTGLCDAALIPEVDFSMVGLARWMKKQMHDRYKRIPHGLIVMAETAIPTDALKYVDFKDEDAKVFDVGLTRNEKDNIRKYVTLRDCKWHIEGQTSDDLRTAGLKIVSKGLPLLLPRVDAMLPDAFMPDWNSMRVFTNEPRHILRAIRPSCSDVIIGQRLGTLAVDNAIAGYSDFMISQWLTEYVLVPLQLVVLGRKRIPPKGIFWTSVRAKTGQPVSMV